MKTRNRSFVPMCWGEVGLAILPGLFTFGTGWVIDARDLVPVTGLGLCALLSVAGLARERRVPITMITTASTIESLIERVLAGDESAARELHDAHYPAVLRLAYLLLQNLQDAEDATQDAFVYAFGHLAQYDPERSAFATWLKVIVTSRCRDMQRRRRIKWLSLQELTEAGFEPEDETAVHQPGVVLELVGVQQVVWEALNQVPRKSRQALILRYFGGLSYPEMAQALGCPVSTAKSRVAYGHRALARLLEHKAHIELGYHGYHIGDVP